MPGPLEADEASRDHAPVLALSGDMPRKMQGTDYFQATDCNMLFRDSLALHRDHFLACAGAGRNPSGQSSAMTPALGQALSTRVEIRTSRQVTMW
jgi:hypothetical protein